MPILHIVWVPSAKIAQLFFFFCIFRQLVCFGFLNKNNITPSRGKTQVTARDAANENDAHKPSSAADYKHSF